LAYVRIALQPHSDRVPWAFQARPTAALSLVLFLKTLSINERLVLSDPICVGVMSRCLSLESLPSTQRCYNVASASNQSDGATHMLQATLCRLLADVLVIGGRNVFIRIELV